MDPRLHQTFVMVTDIDRSATFYEETIGLSVADRGDRSIEFDTGDARLMLEEDFTEEQLGAFGLEPPGPDRGEGIIIVLEVDDVDAVYDQAKADDAEVLMEPREVDWGRKLCLIRDPDGYVLEISRPV